ncbi:MAG: preprotein translocase subunit SecE [Ottowia sp.]|jgi:preprotein translocase subunit SecE|uniref:preprotein translocase subunit SecE n=1 Tax=Ottowia sp. TaxID=1898956 RepID=UPI001B7713F4|nr:preprotein translocase subunit SecE [Ottowia sp.]MBP6665517.1 preprotein translocase subunit SecE [Ottowia sp.]MBP7457203.1 preprotein translocase subunit SecE [Ottowia sp.]MBP8894900.1 preprotein translocase subunit SecE [Ottowia sp.]MBP8927261.1 preprotein translocase subunit SecE [Ottowia sp.]MBP9522056.1 preprotein translocase subunit SecE [Ottowia sp.]
MASVQVETVSTGAEKARLAVAGLLVIGALVAFYLLTSQGAIAQWGGLVAGLVLAAVVFFTSESGKRLIGFGRDSWREVKKVVWPTRKETLQTTAFVFAFSIVMALFLWLTDKTLEWALYDLILGWRR